KSARAGVSQKYLTTSDHPEGRILARCWQVGNMKNVKHFAGAGIGLRRGHNRFYSSFIELI
ncbi:hypothetical protein, partial [Stutzerimonas nitrititolerans]|uniref:hypothetical protein n=1 Tax=Stutzerimonas nitrititolerans TaxID=2482751 RepID=UPI00289FC874